MRSGEPLIRHVVTFARVLREVGVEAGPGRVISAVRALDAVDLTRQDDVYFALRLTLVSRRDELDLFDRAFRAWFLRAAVVPLRRPSDQVPRRERLVIGSSAGMNAEPGDGVSDDPGSAGWSRGELLRQKDFGAMTPADFRALRGLLLEVARRRPQRRSRRRRPDRHGDLLDARSLIRRSLRTGGDPLERPFRSRRLVPRKLVVLCDVSGSMDSYARALLLFLHAAVGSGRGVEAFAFGTRLSRLTPKLATRDAEAAIEKCTEAVVDWGGGTRIGASLKQFNDVWGRRALSRGAVVVILSDGWERDDPDRVADEMARIARAAYAVVWVNPLKGSPDYQPLAGGMQAALPYVDRFLPGHNLKSLEALAGVLAGIERRHAA